MEGRATTKNIFADWHIVITQVLLADPSQMLTTAECSGSLLYGVAVCSFALNTAHNSANRAGCIFSTLNSVSPNAIDSRHFATIINNVVFPPVSIHCVVRSRARQAATGLVA